MYQVSSFGLRFFFLIVAITFFVLSQSYSGILVSFLTIPPQSKMLQTLAEVAKSPLPAYILFMNIEEYSKFKGNEDKKKIIEKSIGTNEGWLKIPQVRDRTAFLFSEKKYLQYLIKQDRDMYVICNKNAF